MMPYYRVPVLPEDHARAKMLGDFLAGRWTKGETKMAMAVWWEVVGCQPEVGDLVLASDLQDFVEAVKKLREARR